MRLLTGFGLALVLSLAGGVVPVTAALLVLAGLDYLSRHLYPRKGTT
jgi:hypothetical protein